MKRLSILTVAVIAVTMLFGCDSTYVTEERRTVGNQQEVYNKTQPTPFFDWSLQRQLWIDFYTAQNSAVSTWSFITPLNGGQVMFQTPSKGYPIPKDTQLTNPLMRLYNSSGGVVEQPEPNGLYTSKNTDGTIIMASNDDGTVSPVYTELKVTTFPFPVKYNAETGMWERIKGKEPTIKLDPKKKPASP